MVLADKDERVQLVVPSDPLAPRSVDPELATDASVAREAGSVVATIDHDELCTGSARLALLVTVTPGNIPPTHLAMARTGWRDERSRQTPAVASIGRKTVIQTAQRVASAYGH